VSIIQGIYLRWKDSRRIELGGKVCGVPLSRLLSLSPVALTLVFPRIHDPYQNNRSDTGLR
jgi:hypothetical protein